VKRAPWTCRVFALVLFSLSTQLSAQSSAPRIIHAFVALADNQHQGIVPVPARLGNGEDPEHNLYWGSAYGVKTFFTRSSDWTRISCTEKPKFEVLERCVFKYRVANVYLVADAYRGSEIREAILDFFDAAAGASPETITLPSSSNIPTLTARGGSNLVAYLGHDGLMDFRLPLLPRQKNQIHRDAIMLACASKSYFAEALRVSGAAPLLWTTGLMAPEAYTLKSTLDGWINDENNEQIRDRAAAAYDKYQKCGLRAAHRLFATGW
jgi:hypothetical protein